MLIIIYLIFTNTSSKNSDERIHIVAAENVYGNVAEQIGGKYVLVASILQNPEQDPHTYDPSVADAKKVTEAAIVIENGAGYDAFIKKLIQNNRANVRVMDVSQNEHLSELDNPHLWYNVAIMDRFAQSFTLLLINIDQKHASYYKKNLAVFHASIEKMKNKELQIKQIAAGKHFLATERVGDYLLQDSGVMKIDNDFQKAIEENSDPSANAVTYFQDSLTSKSLSLLLYNTQTTSTATTKMHDLAISHHIPIIGIEETLPKNLSYQKWILQKLVLLDHILEKESQAL